MPRLMQRQEAPFEGRIMGRAPVCIACGNRRVFFVRRGEVMLVVNAWEMQPEDRVLACGRCRSHHSVLLDSAER